MYSLKKMKKDGWGKAGMNTRAGDWICARRIDKVGWVGNVGEQR
jgi:hypothetical protein